MAKDDEEDDGRMARSLWQKMMEEDVGRMAKDDEEDDGRMARS